MNNGFKDWSQSNCQIDSLNLLRIDARYSVVPPDLRRRLSGYIIISVLQSLTLGLDKMLSRICFLIDISVGFCLNSICHI